jgi:hypothetical protein
MAEIEREPRPRSVFEEKKSESATGFPDGGSDESPTRIEEGGKSGLVMNEEDAIARVKAYPDDATPIYLTWKLNDPTNPRNWPVRCKKALSMKIWSNFHPYRCGKSGGLPASPVF